MGRAPTPHIFVFGVAGPTAFGFTGFVEWGEPCIGELIVLNALVPPPQDGLIYISRPLRVEEAVTLLKLAVVVKSFIGHQATAELLTRLAGREIPVNRAEWKPYDNALALIVRLARRLEKPGELIELKTEDLEFRLVRYKLL
jgi:hypothetical protein